jgi:lipoate-protein ligase A
MDFLDVNLACPASNLACDEALLDWCEASPDQEVLRCWQPATTFLVLGYGNRVSEEVQLESCRADRVPVLRRCSGGGSVLQGPGCLNYSLILQLSSRPELQSVTSTNRFIMEQHRLTLSRLLGQPVRIQGSTDLTLDNLKFSGNAQRRKRHCLLFHGTFLLDLNLARVERYLAMPPRQPAYRAGRPHSQFLTHLSLPPTTIQEALREVWEARQYVQAWPKEATQRLAREKYTSAEWNERR